MALGESVMRFPSSAPEEKRISIALGALRSQFPRMAKPDRGAKLAQVPVAVATQPAVAAGDERHHRDAVAGRHGLRG